MAGRCPVPTLKAGGVHSTISYIRLRDAETVRWGTDTFREGPTCPAGADFSYLGVT
jgi:hypothetical protein